MSIAAKEAMMKTTVAVVLVGSIVTIGESAAQTGDPRLLVGFRGGSIVTPTTPVVTLELWAVWEPIGGVDNVFGTVALDFRVSEAGLENPMTVLFPPISNTWGTPEPLGYAGAAFGQVHAPSI